MNIPKLIFLPNPRLSRLLAKPQDILPITDEQELQTVLASFANKADRNIRPFWPGMVETLHEYTGLTFLENTIDVHIVQYIKHASSSPITMQIGWKQEYCKQLLLHESVHRLFSRNLEYKFNWKKYFVDDGHYSGYHPYTHLHIFVHALIQKVILEYWDDRDLMDRILQETVIFAEREKNDLPKLAWDIVQEKGYQAVMDEFHELLKNPAYAQPLGRQ